MLLLIVAAAAYYVAPIVAVAANYVAPIVAAANYVAPIVAVAANYVAPIVAVAANYVAPIVAIAANSVAPIVAIAANYVAPLVAAAAIATVMYFYQFLRLKVTAVQYCYLSTFYNCKQQLCTFGRENLLPNFFVSTNPLFMHPTDFKYCLLLFSLYQIHRFRFTVLYRRALLRISF